MSNGIDASGANNADQYFIDGEFEYVVRTVPAAFPNLLALDPVGPGGTPGDLLFELLVFLSSGVVATWRDDRWKVLVARRRMKFPRLVHVIAVEFFATVGEAEARQADIRRAWVAGSHRDDPVITLRTVGRLRRSSRGSAG